MHQSWRGASEWRNENLTMYTGSNEACKLYDASLSQMVGSYNDATLGGIEKTISRLHESDPDFVMGRVISTGMNMMGTGKTVKKDQFLQKQMQELLEISERQSNFLSDREKRHVQALNLLSQGELKKATLEWETILNEHPTDILATKFSNITYIYTGQKQCLRDSVGSVIPLWNRNTPLYGYLYGMYAFGLEESNYFAKAEEVAYQALAINPKDSWATHTLGHVFEMNGRAEEGIKFYNNTISDWEFSDMLRGHNYWHLALFHIENSEYEVAIEILDKKLVTRANENGPLLDLLDLSSLLYRLNLEGQDVTKYWEQIRKLCMPHIESHGLIFTDMHFMLALTGAGDNASIEKFMNTLTDYLREDTGSNVKVGKELGIPLMEALLAAKEERFDDVVNLLTEILPNLYQIGGSDAQRDIMDILLITSSLRSSNLNNKLLGKRLLLQRKNKKGQCTLEKRLKVQLDLFV